MKTKEGVSRRFPRWPGCGGTVVVDVVLQHLVLQDATELREGLQVDDVDDEGPQEVVQRQAQLLQ